MSVTLKKTKLQYQYTKIDLEEHEDSLAGYVVEFNKNVLNYEESTEEDAQEIQSDATHENKQKEREHRENLREERLRQKELEKLQSFEKKEKSVNDNFSSGLEKFKVDVTKEN